MSVTPRLLRSSLPILFLISWTLCVEAQQTIHVPQDSATIQGAIDAASSGDTILVSPGTYNENIDFHGKVITLTSGGVSFSDAATTSTIINGTHDGPVVTFDSGETSGAVLNGFTVQNGHSSVGASLLAAGVWISGASPTISNNLITNNTGNGILLTNLDNAVIRSNSLIQGNDIRNTTTVPPNVPGEDGSGLAISTLGNIQVIGNTIENNIAYSPVINGPSVGGGVSIEGFVLGYTFSLLLKNNIVRNNRATQGSGIFQGATFSPPNLILLQNLIYNNTSPTPSNGTYDGEQVDLGGSTQAPYPTLTEINNTIYGPGSAQELFYTFAPSVIENNIFFNSVAGVPNNPYPDAESGLWCADNLSAASPITIANNDIYNVGPLQDGGCNLDNNNLAVDPQFMNVTGNDLHTQPTSPVVGAGTVSAPNIPSADLDNKARLVCGKIDMGAYQTHPNPPITLSASPNPVAGGSSVTFTAQVTGNCNVPTGTVTFLDNGVAIGTGTLNGSAIATLSTAFLTVGTHQLTATYPGDFNFDDSTSNTYDLVVTGLPTTTSITATPNPAKAFQPITLTASVTDPYVPVTGTVTFTAGTTVLGTATLVNGVAAITTSQLGAGTYTVTATFNATTQFATSSASLQLQVDGAATTTTLSSSLNPSLFGQPVTFRATVALSGSTVVPQGTVTFRDGAAVLGTSSLDGTGTASLTTSTLTVGTHSVTAVYGGSTNANTSASPALTQVVNPTPTTVTLTGTPNPASVGQQVTFTAMITGTLGGVPASGTITFADQFGTIGTAAVNAGIATLSTSTLSAGTHHVTASFTGSGSFAGSASAPFTEVIQSFDFAITLSSPTISIASGASATLTAQIQGVGNVAGNVMLTAANVPQPATLTFNPAAVAFAAGANGSSVLSIATALKPHASLVPNPDIFGRSSARVFAALAIVPFFFVRRRKTRSMLLGLIGLVSLACLSGCTNISYPVSRLSPGTYVIPITGVDQTSQITHTVNLTLNVTQ